MASLADRSYSAFQQQTSDNACRYPEPPSHNNFGISSPMDMNSIPADPFAAFSSPGQENNLFAQQHPITPTSVPTSATSVGSRSSIAFEPSLYGETPSYILTSNSGGSPSLYADDADLRLTTSSLSTTSVPSAPSSAIGSPQSNHGQLGGMTIHDWSAHALGGAHPQPSIVGSDYIMGTEYPNFSGPGMDELTAFDFVTPHAKAFVDPSLVHPDVGRLPMGIPSYDGQFHHHSHHYPASPALSSSPQPNMLRTNSSSPFLHGAPFQGYGNSPYSAAAMDANARRLSMNNFISPSSGEYPSGDETKEKQRCTYPDCGKVFKDLKAHMLTHQNERPEKCPIQTCEYHIKGFARKYDKNRHTLTHYKGTMVCGFCPGSGSAAEKSFNRADVFKRHLTAVHNVEQTPPNSRKKTSTSVSPGRKLSGYAPDATGKCSTCSQTFSNAQDFYEHLDDCVLRIVQQEDPAEAINAQRLAEVENDKSVHQTLEKNNLPIITQTDLTPEDDEDYDMGEDDEADDASSRHNLSPNSAKRKTNPINGVQKSRGMTHSRGGVPLATKARGRKNRKDYPSSWGFDKGQMTMKKRIMAVFDGPRRLAKDDMMLSTDHEVRLKLSDGKSYVTDLDVQTLKRAEGFLNATDEEKGPWISDDPSEEQLKEMQEMLSSSTATI